MTKILIVDDHQMFLDGIKSILQNEENFKIVNEALSGDDALRILKKKAIDIVLLDISMPQQNGLEVTEKIKQEFPDVKVILLTMHSTKVHIEKALALNADGYILKNTGKEELVKALNAVMSGRKYFSEEVKNSFMNGFSTKMVDTFQAANLSKQETEILKLVAQGLTTTEIASKLFISQHTVNTYRKNLLSKLDVKNAVGLAMYAIQQGLVDVDLLG